MDPRPNLASEDVNDTSDNSSYTPKTKQAWVFISKVDNSTNKNYENQIASYLENYTGSNEKIGYVIYIDDVVSQGKVATLETSGLDVINQKRNKAKDQLIELINSVDISDENLESQFRKQFLFWIEEYKIFAIEHIWNFYRENKFTPSLLNEILELVGVANLEDLNEEREALFKCMYDNDNLEIRHGVLEGIANLNSQIAIPILKNFLIQEKSNVLKKVITSYIEQLENLQVI